MWFYEKRLQFPINIKTLFIFFQKPLDKPIKLQYNVMVHRGVAQLVEYWSPKPWVVGSSPSAPANKKGTFVYQKFLFCLSKPQAWHIIAAQRAVHIIKGGKPPLYLITRQRVFSLRLDDMQCFALMIYRNKLRMIYKACALIYLRKCGIILSRG